MNPPDINPQAAASLRDQCSIARASGILGDGWTLMIIRELFWGYTRYDQIATKTGIASNILADRLRKLVESGIIDKSVAADDARRYDYTLTDKGRDLFPLLMAVMAWGDRWTPGDTGPLIKLRHTPCGKLTKPGLVCTACGHALSSDSLATEVAKPYRQAV
jgi:DNA-binding HxlR family transcriptional regulator